MVVIPRVCAWASEYACMRVCVPPCEVLAEDRAVLNSTPSLSCVVCFRVRGFKFARFRPTKFRPLKRKPFNQNNASCVDKASFRKMIMGRAQSKIVIGS